MNQAKMKTRPMSEVLAEGKENLATILVSSRINCTTCQFSEITKYDMGTCKKTNKFLSCPGLLICMEWRQKQEGKG